MDWFKQLIKIVAAGLGAALAVLATAMMNGTPLTLALIGQILISTVLVRIAMWVVATYGPKPAPAPSADRLR